MKKTALALCFLLVFGMGLLVNISSVKGADTTPPYYYEIKNKPVSPVFYVENETYILSVKWEDESSSIDTVILNFNGSEYVADNVSEMYKVEMENLSVGYYVYSWWANDTADNENSTKNLVYHVSGFDYEGGNVCVSSEILRKTTVQEICTESGCNVTATMDYVTCDNGCYEGQCRPEGINQLFLLAIFIIIIGIGLYLFMRR